eukprot:1293210-Prymnesium_polylepis.1
MRERRISYERGGSPFFARSGERGTGRPHTPRRPPEFDLRVGAERKITARRTRSRASWDARPGRQRTGTVRARRSARLS